MRIFLLNRSTLVVGTLLVGSIVVEGRYYQQVQNIHICRFQAGYCADNPVYHLPEGRLNLDGLASTSNGSISIQVAEIIQADDSGRFIIFRPPPPDPNKT